MRQQRVRTASMVGAVVVALVLSAVPMGVARAASVPAETLNNPTCGDLGLLGLKVTTSTPVGRHVLPGVADATVTVTARTGPERFDWSSTYGIDAMIVKGREASNVYRYNKARSDTNLSAPPINSNIDTKINFIEICYELPWAPPISADTTTVDGARGVAVRDIPLSELPADLINRVAGADLVNDAGTGLEYAGRTSLRFSGTSLRFAGTGLQFASRTSLRFSGASLQFAGRTSLRFASRTGLRFSGDELLFSGEGIGMFVDARSATTGLGLGTTGLVFDDTGMRASEVPAWDVPLSDLQPPEGHTWNDVFEALGEYQDFPPQNVTFGQLLDELNRDFAGVPEGSDARTVLQALATMGLLDLDPNAAVLRDVSLVALLLGTTRLSDITLPDGQTWCRIIDPGTTSCDAPPGDTTVLNLNLAGLRSDILPLDRILLDQIDLDPDSVLADLLADGGAEDDLFVPAESGDTLATYLLRGIDALNVPWEQLPLRDSFDVRRFALGGPVTFTSSWTESRAVTRRVQVTVPTGFVPAAGSPACAVTAGTCTVTPVAGGFDVTTTAASTVTLRLTYRPSGLLGGPTPPVASGTFGITAGGTTRTFPVTVADPWGTAASAGSPPPIEPDVLYFANAAAGDVDIYDADISPYAPGSHVAVRISNLTDDADLVLYRYAGRTSLRFAGRTSLRFAGTSLRFAGDTGDQSVDSRESETLEDVPIDQSRVVEDVSANRALTPEAAEGFTGPDTDTFEVQVAGFNAASTDYVLRVAVTEFADACTIDPATLPATTVTFSGDANPSTVVLYAEDRFSAEEQAIIEPALARLSGDDRWPLAIGVVDAGPDWTQETGSCSVFAANQVATDVADQVNSWAAERNVEHVMIIGSDDRLPSYRSPDTTLLANEANYASTIGGLNPLTASKETQHILTDDVYGDLDPWPFLNRLYFTPDRAIGRLVESADDIAGQIDRFVANGGQIDVERTFTAGYDFLTDAAIAINDNLAGVTDRRALEIDQDWTVADVRTGLAGSDNGASLSIASINAHMDQGLLLSAAGDAQGDNPAPSEVGGPTAVIPSGVNGAVMFTAGCHAGASQPYADAERTDDWAQSLAGGPAAVYLANTGYGYGIDQPIVAYSEELLANFADLLELDGMTVGQAAMRAKQQYFAAQLEIDPYDEKSQMQLTTYGVPMYSLTPVAPAAAGAAALSTIDATTTGPVSAVAETVTDPITGLASASVTSTATFGGPLPGAENTSYYALTEAVGNGVPATTGFEAPNGKPIQPKFTLDVTAPDPALTARGVFIESLTSRSVDLGNPTIARATVDNTSTESAPDAGTVIFPTALANVQTEQTADGPRGRLTVVPAQYNSENDLEQMLVDALELRTYYAPAAARDFVRPQFQDVSANASGTDILFRAAIADPDDPAGNVFGTGVQRVLVQYLDAGTWKAVEMFPANAARTEWSGGLRADTITGVFFVQAVDGAGNVAVTANKGENYRIEGEPAQAVGFVTGPIGDNGWFVGPATVELKGSAVTTSPSSHTYSVNGATPQPYTGPFPVDSPGVNEITIQGPGAAPIVLTIPIDAIAPTVDLENPIALLTAGQTAVPATLSACSDVPPGSGLRDLDPTSPSSCELTEAPYTLTLADGTTVGPFTLSTARGQDIAGNIGTESQSAVILSGTQGTNGFYTTPVILGILGGAATTATVDLDGVGGAAPAPYTSPVTITANASVIIQVGDDTFGPFTVNVDRDLPTASANLTNGAVYDLGQNVPVTCTFADNSGGSGLASTQCGAVTSSTGTSPLNTVLDTGSFGAKTFTVTATDRAGNVTTTVYNYTVADRARPTVELSPQPGGTYDLFQPVTVTCTFRDTGGSGLASVACGGTPQTVSGNGPIIRTFTLDTSTPGTRSFTVSARDGAGNTSDPNPLTYTYTVRDTFACDPVDLGFLAAGDIVRCGARVNPGGATATLSVLVRGQIDTGGMQYRLRLATSATQSGNQVRWAANSFTGTGLISASIPTTDRSRLDFVIDLARVGVRPGGTLWWNAETQQGVASTPTAGLIDLAPNTGRFQLARPA